MPWVKICDTFDSHRKVRRAGNEATGLFVRALAYCSGQLTDGLVDEEWVTERAGRRGPQLAKRLIDAGLWEQVDGGWQITSFLEYNPSGARTAERRAEVSAARSAAGRRGAGARWRDGK